MVHGAGQHINPNQISGENARLEQAMASTAADMLEELTEKGKSKKADRNEAAKKKVNANAVSVLNQEASAEDLAQQFKEKIGHSKFHQEQAQMTKTLKQAVKHQVEEHFKNEFKDKSKDSVTLSKQATTQKEAEVKKHQQTRTQERSSTVQQQIHQEHAGAQGAGVNSQSETRRRQRLERQKQSDTTMNKDGQKTQSQTQTQKTPQERQARMIQQYAAAYSETLVNDEPRKKQKTALLREQLQKEGFSTKRITELESKINSMMRKDLKERVRKGFMNFALSYNHEKLTPELIKHREHFVQLEQYAELSGGFGPTSMVDIKNEAREELRAFQTEQMDEAMVRDRLNSSDPKTLMQAFKTFDNLGSILGFDAAGYVRHFQDKLDDQGLIEIMGIGYRDGVMDTEHEGSGQQQQDQEPTIPQEQIENLEDRLRVLFSQQRIVKGPFRSIDIALKIRKTIKQMKTAGIYNKDRVEAIRQEGDAIAKLRFNDMLIEGLEEETALSVLNGPEYDLVEKKINFAKKGLSDLGEPVDEKNLKDWKDEINKKFFPIIREEYLKINMHLDMDNGNIFLKREAQTYLAHLERLKEESDIKEDINPSMFREVGLDEEVNITEAA